MHPNTLIVVSSGAKRAWPVHAHTGCESAAQISGCCSRTPHTRFSKDPALDQEVFIRVWGRGRGRGSAGRRLEFRGSAAGRGEPGLTWESLAL